MSSSTGSNLAWAQRPYSVQRGLWELTVWGGVGGSVLPPQKCPPPRGWFPLPALPPSPLALACLHGRKGSWLRAEATAGRISSSPCLPGGEPTDQEFDFPSPSSGSLACSHLPLAPRTAHFVHLEGACGAGCCLSRLARDAPAWGPGKAALRGAIRTRLWMSQIRSKMTSLPSCQRGL